MINMNMAGVHYGCYYAYLTNDGNSTHIQNVTGIHLKPNHNADVKGFSLSGDEMRRRTLLPQGFETFFPDLVAFDWSSWGNLTSITKNDLMPFPNLQYLNLARNALSSLDGDLFAGTPMLRYIDLSNNLLQNVGYGLLDNLNRLTSAYFDGNPCIKLEKYMASAAGIQALRVDLRDLCPPLGLPSTNPPPSSTIIDTTPTKSSTHSTTTPATLSTTIGYGHCSIGCVELIETLRKEVSSQKGEISIHSKAIVELEKLIRENR